MKFILRLLAIAALIGILFIVGVQVYSCVAGDNKIDNGPKLPEIESAKYTVYIENTGRLLITNDYDQFGTDKGSRVYVLNNYWELQGNKYVFKSGILTLDEGIFGTVTIKPRVK